MVADTVLTPDDTSLYLTYTPAATCILVAGYLGLVVIERLDELLQMLPKEDTSPPVLIRICSSGLEFGASVALRQVLSKGRAQGLALAVWADEPLVRRTIPMSLLHSIPPCGGATWNEVVPAWSPSTSPVMPVMPGMPGCARSGRVRP